MLLTMLCGCGGNKPVRLGETGAQLAKQLESAIGRKDTAAVGRLADIVRQRREQKKMTQKEADMLTSAIERANAGEWEAAQKTVSESLQVSGASRR
jgi:hypothetical protein